jgi:hypothetical protein
MMATDGHAPPESEWPQRIASASYEQLRIMEQHCASRVDQFLNTKKPGSTLDQSRLEEEIKAWTNFWNAVTRERLKREDEDAQ